MKYEGVIKKKSIEVAYTLVISVCLLVAIFKCNEVPVHITDLRNGEMKDSTEFLLESYPYSISNLFALHDISKEEYSYLLPQVSGRKRYTFMRNYEGAEWSNTGHPLTIKSRDMLVVFPEHPEISFYTK